MTVDHERLAAALSTPSVPEASLSPALRGLLEKTSANEYADITLIQKAREAVAALPLDERKRRAKLVCSCWDGDPDTARHYELSRALCQQDVESTDPTVFLGSPGFAPIGGGDFAVLLRALSWSEGSGEDLAACVAFVAFGDREPRAFECMMEALRRIPEHASWSFSFGCTPDVNDRLFELVLASWGHDPSVASFEAHVRALNDSTGAASVGLFTCAAKWLEARGHAPFAPAIDLREPDIWDGGHAIGGNAVQAYLSRLWTADPKLVEEASAAAFGRMTAPAVVADIARSLPFEVVADVEGRAEFQRVFRLGRLVVAQAGKKGKPGRLALKLHPDEAKAKKDAAKKVADFSAKSA